MSNGSRWRLRCLPLPAQAQSAADYPSGPVKILVPFAAGGPTDVVARILADHLAARWGGKPVVIENRPGAGTILATAAVAKAPPDGLTLGVSTNSYIINPAINHNLSYDTLKDFSNVSMVVTQPVALVAPPSRSPAARSRTSSRRRRSRPTNYTSPGPRGVGDLAGQMLKQQRRHCQNFTHINYNGSAPALTDVIAGRVPLMFDIWHSARRYVETGELKLIAGASAERLPGAANVPTIAESYPGVEVIAFNAIVAPGGTPGPIVEKLSADIRAIVTSATFVEKVRPFGVTPQAMTPREIDAWMLREIDRWKEVAKASNIKAE